MIQYKIVQDRFILQTMYSKPMVQQTNICKCKACVNELRATSRLFTKGVYA